MKTVVITPPEPLLSAAEVRARLGVTDEDIVLDALIGAAHRTIEPPFGWVGRAFGLQTLECSFTAFPHNSTFWSRIRLPWPPLVSVGSVVYTDGNGNDQTVDAATYKVSGIGTAQGVISPLYGTSWPSAYPESEVRVRFVAGYGPDDPALLPVKQAVILSIGHLRSLGRPDLFLSREEVAGVGAQQWVLSEVAGKVISASLTALLSPYRVFES